MDIQKFQGWTIENCIGVGAYGKVYRITRDMFGYTEEAALKVIDIPKSQSEVDSFKNEGMTEENVTTYYQGMVEKIVEEFVLMSKLKGNSNIVSYEDHVVEEKKDEFGWRIYIRMELLTPLFTYIKEHGMSEQDVIKLGIDICKGLELCKKYNIIHRDIKPENIFISSAGDYKLGDFGIARELEKTAAGLSKVGTLNYMAPEVNKGYEYNSTVDIYSLGIVLYRLLNENRLPFMPPAPQPIKYSDQDSAITMRLSGQKMPKPSKASAWLSLIVLKACSYLPEERYALASDMRKALEKLRRDDIEDKVILEIAQGGVSKSSQKDENTEEKNNSENISETEKNEQSNADNMTMMLFDVKENLDLKENLIEQNNRPIENNNEQKDRQNTNYEKVFDELENYDVVQSKRNNRKRIAIYSSAGVAALLTVILVFINYRKNQSPKVDAGIKQAQTSVSPTKKMEETTEAPVEKVLVPNLSDMTKKELESKLSECKLLFKYAHKKYSDKVEANRVILQQPKANMEVEIGSEITIVLSRGPEKISVPNVKGLSQKKAIKILKKAGLKYVVKKNYSDMAYKGYVYDQNIKAKTRVKKGRKIIIYVSKGSVPVKPTETPSYTNNNYYKPVKRPVVTKKPVKPKKPIEDSDGTFKNVDSEDSDGTFK